MSTMECSAKPTKYQPTDEDWKCPKCGAGKGVFYIEDSQCDADCDKLHDTDTLACMDCSYAEYNGESGKQFASRVQRKNNLETCGHCKGTGLVKKGKS